MPDRVADRSGCRGSGVGSEDEPGDPRPGGDRHHAGQGPKGAAAAERPACYPAGGGRDHERRPGRARARARGSPVSSRMSWCRNWPPRCRPPLRGVHWCSTWPPSRGRRRGSPSSGTSTCWPSMRRGSRCTKSSSTLLGCPASGSGSSSAAPRPYWVPRVQFAEVSRPGTPLHDPARLAAALEGVRLRGTEPGGTLQQPTVPTPARTVDGPRGDDPWR